MIDLSAITNSSVMFIYLDVLPRDAVDCIEDLRGADRHERKSRHVNVSVITTNNGAKKRTIYAPSRQLSWVQNRIRHGLLLKLPVENCVHGFVRQRGIVSNAHAHTSPRAWVMNMDLKDFFPSINPKRVHGFFVAAFNMDKRVAYDISKLTTFKDHLCQGFSTSPDIANFLSYRMDKRLMGLAAKNNLTYTRYADDLTFSSADPSRSVGAVKRKVTDIVNDEGFTVNPSKVAVMRGNQRQKITGLVVGNNGSVNIPRRTRRLIRSAVDHWQQQTPERRAQIRGWISYMNAVNPADALAMLQSIAEVEAGTRVRTRVSPVSQKPFGDDVASLTKHHHHQEK